MSVSELIAKLQALPPDALVYFDNQEHEANEIKSAEYEPYQFSNYKRVAKEPYWQFLGYEVRNVALLSEQERGE
jgi:hypothetical protein